MNTRLRPTAGPAAMPSTLSAPRLAPADWDALRLAFHGSPLLEASLSGLAQNIDGCSWPLETTDEKPSAYVDLSYGEALARLRAHALPPARLDVLADILRGTLAFDESFGAMAAVTGGTASPFEPIRRNLERLGIPSDFPISLCALTPGTIHFCERESLHTLGAFLDFSRSATRSVIVGGEFRDLLNAVAHIDEATLARYLPFRPRTSGLYLVEALAHLVRPLDIEARIALARNPDAAPPELRARATRLVEHFAEQTAHLRALAAQNVPFTRLVASLEDLSLESAVAGLLGLYLSPAAAPAAPLLAGPKEVPRRWRPRWWRARS